MNCGIKQINGSIKVIQETTMLRRHVKDFCGSFPLLLHLR
jgi:hypothetical protein